MLFGRVTKQLQGQKDKHWLWNRWFANEIIVMDKQGRPYIPDNGDIREKDALFYCVSSQKPFDIRRAFDR